MAPENLLTYLLLLTLALSACHKDHTPELQPNPNRIRFDALAVGQKSRYLALTGERQYLLAQDQQSVYSDDTLELQIVAKDENGYLVEETLHTNGDFFTGYKADKDSVYQYYLSISGDSLFVRKSGYSYFRSRIFGSQVIVKGLILTDFTEQRQERLTRRFRFSEIGGTKRFYMLSYALFDVLYPRLNVFISNDPLRYDVNGETYLYTATFGLVRFATYGVDTEAISWNLLPQ